MSIDEAHLAASDETLHPAATSDRRALFAKGAAAAAAAAVAGLALGKQASAANGDTMLVGAVNTATLTTSIVGGSSLRVDSGASTGLAVPNYGTKESSLYGYQAAANRVGVIGSAHGLNNGWGVFGYNASSTGRGVVGINVGESGIGVYGEHNDTSTTGTGVHGRSRFGHGVTGQGTLSDFLAAGSGQVRLSAVGSSGTTTAQGALGTIARDSSGNLWYAFAGNNWRKIAGSGTAGAFHPITPTRVYDSRWADGKVLANQNRVVSVKDGRSLTGTITTANLVPAGATAIVGNLTIAGTDAGAGALAVTPGDAAALTASTINWNGAGVLLANGFTVKLDASQQVKVFCIGTGTNFIIDIAGYYL